MDRRRLTGRCPAPEALRDLRRKYERMLALRRLHARARADGGFEEPDPRPELARLAAQFPGALREIDTLPMDVIAARIDALTAAIDDPSTAAPWMTAQELFHRLTRGALLAKRWLGGRRHTTPDDRAAFREALGALPAGADALPFVEALDALASPPGGRLVGVVYATMADDLGVTAAEARALVFGGGRGRASR